MRTRSTPSIVRLLLAALVTASSPTAPAAAEVLDRLVAVVDGQPILQSDVRTALALGLVAVPDGQDREPAALERLIERRLVMAEVERYGPGEPAPDRIAGRVEAMASALGRAAYSRALDAGGLDDARLRALIRDTLRMEDYLAQRFGAAAVPTDEEARRYVDEHPGEFVRDGKPLAAAEAEPMARERLAAARRATLVSDWVASLRRRADVRLAGRP